MRWMAVIVVGWVVLTFLVGVLVGHLMTRRPRISRAEHGGAADESDPHQAASLSVGAPGLFRAQLAFAARGSAWSGTGPWGWPASW